MKNKYFLGAIYNAAFMFFAVLIYQVLLREIVVRFEWAKFLGETWFFAILALILPSSFLIRGHRQLCLGAMLGILIYFLILPFAFLYGD